MTQTSQTSIALSADYADALLTARRAKNRLFWILLLLLLVQLTLFFVARYSMALVPVDTTTAPVDSDKWLHLMQYVIGLSGLLALGSVLVLGVVLLLILAIMLIGRLIGVARVVSAFLWTVVLCVILFPWQGFLNDGALASEGFRLVGALFTWGELVRDARFGIDGDLNGAGAFLKWSRFVGFPLLSLVILLMVQRRSGRGLRLALGETDLRAQDSHGAEATMP